MTASPMELSVTCARSFSFEQRLGDRRALDHADQGFRQQVTVEVVLQEIILRSMLHRQLGDFLILRSTEDQDRNLRRGVKEPFEGLDSVSCRAGRGRPTPLLYRTFVVFSPGLVVPDPRSNF